MVRKGMSWNNERSNWTRGKRRIESLMRRGYLESSDEDLYLAEFDLEAGNEVME